MRANRAYWYGMLASVLIGCGSHAPAETAGGNATDSADGGPFEWRIVDPESVGMDGDRLRAAVEYIDAAALPVRSMIVVKEGRITLEHYFGGNGAETLYNIESSTKSLVSLLVGMAIEDGLIEGVDARVLGFFEGRSFENPSDEKSAMTLEDLLTMRSGLAYDNNEESFQNETDSLSFILDHAMASPPGTEWVYSSADTQLVAAVLVEATDQSLGDFAKARLFDPLGMSPGKWLRDGGGVHVAGYGLNLTARDMARVGLLMLNRGVWDGERLVSEQWIDESLTVRATTPWSRGDFGYLWWIKRFEGYCAGGRFGQQINFFPDRDIVVVYTASLPMETSDSVLDTITQAFVLGTIDMPEPGDRDTGAPDPCGSAEDEWIAAEDIARFGHGVFSYGDEVSTQPATSYVYNFCISNIEWLDTNLDPLPGK